MKRFLVFDDGFHIPHVFGENGYLGLKEDLMRIIGQPHSDVFSICHIDLEDAWIEWEENEDNKIAELICLMDSNERNAEYDLADFEEIWNSEFVMWRV